MKAKTGKSSLGFKRLICLLLVMLSVLTPVTSVLPGADLGMVTTAEAEDCRKSGVTYFKKYTGKKKSLVDALKEIGTDSSYEHRKYIAKENGMSDYTGKAAQNDKLLKLLKQGKLKTRWIVTYQQPIVIFKGWKLGSTVKVKYCGSGISKVAARSNNSKVMDVRYTVEKNKEYEWSIVTITLTGKEHLDSANIVFTTYGNKSVTQDLGQINIPVVIL